MSHKTETLSLNKIILGVTGGIAAYKTPDLVRRIVKTGAKVQVVMTASATEFVAPLSLQAVSGRVVRTKLLDMDMEAHGMGHIELARWADRILIAPASADFIAQLACGRANDLLSALCLTTEASITVAPAMNRVMWEKPPTQRNIAQLQKDGILILGPGEGEQACGEQGAGRMLEPQILCDQLLNQETTGLLNGLHVLITAGPTREALDPVRFISNRSSGKQGFSLAEACIKAGARVTLVAGPVALATPHGVERIDVTTAEEMYAASLRQVGACDLFIGAAAVADYRPTSSANTKIKKTAHAVVVKLTENPDIIAAIAHHSKRPYVVGFAAETNNIEAYAKDKLVRKNLDMIVANDVSQPGIGFDADDNQVTLISKEGQISLPKSKKSTLSAELVRHISRAMALKTAQKVS